MSSFHPHRWNFPLCSFANVSQVSGQLTVDSLSCEGRELVLVNTASLPGLFGQPELASRHSGHWSILVSVATSALCSTPTVWTWT